MPNLYEQAQQMYPRLDKSLAYRESFGSGKPSSGGLEYYGEGEPDSFDSSRAAVEVFDQRTRPQDVAADIVSHHMVDTDPQVGMAYNKLIGSMSLVQQQKLQDQYKYSQKNFGEQRSFNDWARMSGYPAWLRGGAFDQWKNSEKMYTPMQMEILRGLVRYLQEQH